MAREFDDRSTALKAFDTITALARQAGMSNDPRVRRTLRLISLNPKDTKTISEAASQTLNLIKANPEFLSQQADQNPFQPYPGPIIEGPIALGRVYHPRRLDMPRFGLHPHELNQNVLVSGRAGAGKTNLLMIFLANLLLQKMPFLVLDFKRDYRHLIRRSHNILVFNWKTFKFNPLLPPPGIDSIYWSQIVTDIFFDAFFPTGASASKSAFLEFLNGLYIHFNQRNKNNIPCMFDLKESMQDCLATQKKTGSADRLRTCLSRINPMLLVLEEMLDCQQGYSIENLLQQNVVLELDGLTQELQTFLVNILFFWIFTYRLSKTQRGSLKHVMIFDEAKMVFSREKATGAAPISRLVSTAREMGQALLAADQMPSTLGHAIMANVYTLITLSLPARKDLREMAYAMGLNTEQSSYLNNLPVGRGIVKMADRYTRPFLVKFPRFDIQKNVTDAELERYMAPHLAGLDYKPRVESKCDVHTDNESCNNQTPNTESIKKAADNITPDESPLIPFSLNEKEYAVLMDIKNRPFISVVDRIRDLHLTTYMGKKTCNRLGEMELIREVEIKLGQRGRTRKYHALTAKAQEQIGSQNLGPGKGGFEHVFHQQRLKQYFSEQGYQVKIEEYRNGKAVDLGLAKDNHRIAVEIAMNPLNELSNIEKDFKAGWDEIWILCRDAKVRDHVQEEWAASKNALPGCSVTLFLISDSRFNSNGKNGAAGND
jgi:DNA-binding MarR family transcriptional regulator